jgi:hypothetical protein
LGHVKEILGHKDIRKTLIYIQIDQAIFKNESEYVCKAATSVKQAEELIEAGFEFVCDVECTKLFRKLK